MAETKYIIHLAQGDLPRPAAPLEIDETLRVVGGVGPQDLGARLIGFATPNTEQLKVTATAAVEDPEAAVGLDPVLGKRGTFFRWGLLVEVIEFIDPAPEEPEEGPTEPAPEEPAPEPEPEVDEDQAFIAGEMNG